MMQRLSLNALRSQQKAVPVVQHLRIGSITKYYSAEESPRGGPTTTNLFRQQQRTPHRFFTTTTIQDDATAATRIKKKKKKGHTFVPRKAPVLLTESARTLFRSLLENPPSKDVLGIVLNYHQSSSGEPRMVFSFDFLTTAPGPDDEAVSLEILDDGSPKPPAEAMDDGLPKLYIHHNAFMKVLGGKVDVDLDTLKMTIYDREGNVMDPNA